MRALLRLGQRLALVLAAVLGTLVVLEVGLRVVGYAGAETRQPFRASHEFGEISGETLRALMPFDDDGTRVHLRGQDVPYARRPGVTRVLFVGDSDTAGSGVSLEQSFPMRFAGLVDEAAPGTTEIFNFGVPGMSPPGEYTFFTRHLAALRPDVVVLGLFMPNDLNFSLDDGRAPMPGSATMQESFAHVRDRFALLHFLHLRLLAASGRGGALAYEVARHDPALLPYALSHRGLHARRYDLGELLTYLVEDVPLTDAMWAAVEDVFRRFQNLGAERGFQFVVAILPAGSPVFARLHVEGMTDVVEQVNRFAGETFTPADFDVHKATRRVRAICRRTGTLCVDPTDRMRGTPPERFYGLGNHHSAEMFALVGDELFLHWDAGARRFVAPDRASTPRGGTDQTGSSCRPSCRRIALTASSPAVTAASISMAGVGSATQSPASTSRGCSVSTPGRDARIPTWKAVKLRFTCRCSPSNRPPRRPGTYANSSSFSTGATSASSVPSGTA